jgi:hypothetical protein
LGGHPLEICFNEPHRQLAIDAIVFRRLIAKQVREGFCQQGIKIRRLPWMERWQGIRYAHSGQRAKDHPDYIHAPA